MSTEKNLHFLSKIKAITLDWGDTLVHVLGKDQGFYDFRLLYQTLKPILSNIDDQELQEKVQYIVNTYYRTYKASYNRASLNWVDCNKSTLIKPLIQDQFPSQTFDWEAIFQKFCHQDERLMPFYAGLPALFTEFKKRNWKIGILSHVNIEEKYVVQNFQKNHLAEFIDFYSLSGDLGVTKPHPKHFEDAAIKSNCQPEEILHIGDHPEKDGKGALQSGFHCGLIAESLVYGREKVANVDVDFFINSIFEIRNVLAEFEKNPDSTFYSKYPHMELF